jgi:prepilin-type N-terminal cleavage/methylation domain-containing protein
MTKKSLAAFTLIEMLVVIAIIATIAAFALPAITGAMTRGQLAQAVSNARQIHLATFAMTTDGTQTGDAKYQWPGDLAANTTDPTVTVTTVLDFVTRLVDNDYLKAGDLKVFATTGVTPWNGTYTKPADANSKGTFTNPAFDGDKNCAFKIYLVTEKDAGNAIFLATKNFKDTGNSTTAIDSQASPFGDKGFVIFHKGGDGTFYKKQQASSMQLLGSLPGQSDSGTQTPETPAMYLKQQ